MHLSFAVTHDNVANVKCQQFLAGNAQVFDLNVIRSKHMIVAGSYEVGAIVRKYLLVFFLYSKYLARVSHRKVDKRFCQLSIRFCLF